MRCREPKYAANHRRRPAPWATAMVRLWRERLRRLGWGRRRRWCHGRAIGQAIVARVRAQCLLLVSPRLMSCRATHPSAETRTPCWHGPALPQVVLRTAPTAASFVLSVVAIFVHRPRRHRRRGQLGGAGAQRLLGAVSLRVRCVMGRSRDAPHVISVDCRADCGSRPPLDRDAVRPPRRLRPLGTLSAGTTSSRTRAGCTPRA